jgi:hypothetical protein
MIHLAMLIVSVCIVAVAVVAAIFLTICLAIVIWYYVLQIAAFMRELVVSIMMLIIWPVQGIIWTARKLYNPKKGNQP